jgi:hypothetical protein
MVTFLLELTVHAVFLSLLAHSHLFADLTEAQVCDWIWANGVDKDEIEANLNQQIATQKNPPVVTPPLPWNQA